VSKGVNAKRAQEILQSAEKIDVEHAGVPVWIESVDEESNTARVHSEGNPQESKIVSVSELEEK